VKRITLGWDSRTNDTELASCGIGVVRGKDGRSADPIVGLVPGLGSNPTVKGWLSVKAVTT
jgi:hypothetical protein